MTPSDVAILFRSRDSHREFEAALERRGIGAYVYKGLGFFDADEIKDVLALSGISPTRSPTCVRLPCCVRDSHGYRTKRCDGWRRMSPAALGASPPAVRTRCEGHGDVEPSARRMRTVAPSRGSASARRTARSSPLPTRRISSRCEGRDCCRHAKTSRRFAR
jgi:hypothetical protein